MNIRSDAAAKMLKGYESIISKFIAGGMTR